MDESTISMTMFNSYLKLPEGIPLIIYPNYCQSIQIISIWIKKIRLLISYHTVYQIIWIQSIVNYIYYMSIDYILMASPWYCGWLRNPRNELVDGLYRRCGSVRSRGTVHSSLSRAARDLWSRPCTPSTLTSTPQRWMTRQCTLPFLRDRKDRLAGMNFLVWSTTHAIRRHSSPSSAMAWCPGVSLQDRPCSQFLQFDATLEGRDEEASGHAGREADRHSLWHGTLDADGFQALCNRWVPSWRTAMIHSANPAVYCLYH